MAALAQGSAAQARERLPLRPPEEQALTEYARTSLSEIDNRFGRLPNPDLVMYVFPHLAGNGRYPVPGYSTVFPMYESVEYALPGETPSTRPGAPLAQQPR
jgi:conjugative transfer region lipoprotein (TIGR03751 family)